MCHVVLALPFIGLAVFWLWPLSVALPVYLVVLFLSGWVYYYTIAAMRRQVTIGPETLVHSVGEVLPDGANGLRVRVQSETWGARSRDVLHPGDRIEVIGLDGLTLRVRRYAEDETRGVERSAVQP